MKLKFVILFFSTILFKSNNFFAQKEYAFASTGQQKLLLNPSLAGSTQGLNVQTIYANSFAAYNPIVQTYFGTDYGFKNGFGLGLSFTNNNYNQKLYVSNQVDLSGAYKIKLNKNITFIPSLQASFIQLAINLDKMGFDGGYPPFSNTNPNLRKGFVQSFGDLNTNKLIKQNISFSSGFILDIDHKITFGASVYDFNQPDVGLFGITKRSVSQLYYVSGVLFKDKSVTLQPYSILKLQQLYENFYEGGFYTNYKMLSLQTACRPTFYTTTNTHFYSFIGGISLKYKKCKLGYTFKSLNTGFRYSAHELFLSALLGTDSKMNRALFID